MNAQTLEKIIKQTRLLTLSGFTFKPHSNGEEQGVLIYKDAKLHDFPVSSDDGVGLYRYLYGFVRRERRRPRNGIW